MGNAFRPPLTKMADGTIKQINPFSETEVWTIPGRAHRPLDITVPEPKPINPDAIGHHCAFCTQRVLETPPEKARLVRKREDAVVYRSTGVDMLTREWDFRRIPNLFEIVSFMYWEKNYGHKLSREAEQRMEAYLADPAGRAHVMGVLDTKLRAFMDADDVAAMPDVEKLEYAKSFFGSGHDLIVARRHFVDDAVDDTQLAGSGTLSPQEHEWYIRLTVDAMEDIYNSNRYAKYVQVFQNWLKPAGASFDHLHKQLVAIDQRSVNGQMEVEKARENPNIYNEAAVDYASFHNLILAENKYAVAIAGFGHRYPTLEIWSKSEHCQPWEHSREELQGMSDLIHAMHAATGTHVPTNEEWHCKPIDADVAIPWKVLIKWRVSTLAGFEGGTKIYVNTIDPWALRDRVVPKLLELRAEGKIANNINIASECSCRVNSLKYNPALQ
ncbi:galactose-1-phosphate uridylyltransferase [Arcanobacterium pluranimalium]|uniref:DUF4921 family protein n=1 Tax=Arcanobacterium pluranimalium TaxID=108028 RepID=UPI00195B8F73|nr:DUF4921 family protein [Arcanobacterium pluranimalium]MBM7824279.1 galactose-1-phosphate uridylyltransferase [Arcanobacterium pluranimalium]